MNSNFENSKPQLNTDIINSLESYFLIKIPQSYLDFLIKINGGHAVKNIFLFPNNNGFITHHWYGVRAEKYFSLLSQMYDKGKRYPNNFIAICDDTSGNKILLSISGDDYGKIYFWDHEMEFDQGVEPDYSNLTLVADSFEEFINNLKSEDELDE